MNWEYKVQSRMYMYHEDYMNQMGADGWECIHYNDQNSSGVVKMVFKREVRSPSRNETPTEGWNGNLYS